MGFLKKIFGSYSQKELKRISPLADKVIQLEDKYRAMPDDELKGMTAILKQRLAQGETLDGIMPDAFAVCREASDRVLQMRHFPVQIIGGIVLHQGRIAEMKTGEGKTLVATLPAYLNALSGNGVHVVTVNEYLAKRDSEWMGKIYKYLGLTVGLAVHGMNSAQKRESYAADITYGTNNEFGFDYLRDNMQIYKENRVQRGFHFAIVDEVDSILIDEARTPLIISGQGDKSTELYVQADRFAKTLAMTKVKELETKEDTDETHEGDYIIDEKARSATLTREGVKKAERYFNVENLMDAENMSLQHHINQAIKANGVMKRDVDYVVKDGQIVIVDEFTGRLMIGRRYNEGLHQAIEAKEKVKVERESKTLATITFQNYFRMYAKLAGMTGTALTEEEEFREIYKLDTIEIPTNVPSRRIDRSDVVYKTERGKYAAVIDQIVECNKKGQPVLVGTISIERSELLSTMLKRQGVKHEVLNAKHHEKEAQIIAQAGKFGAVTIATNMAGRGTDIVLGGNAEYLAKSEMRAKGYSEELILVADSHFETDDEQIQDARSCFKALINEYRAGIQAEAQKVKQAGGLFIIGTERHESRRIDNQLRGRCGRQGDEGETRFYLSLEDDLMRLFGGDRITGVMNMLKVDESTPIENRMLTSTIESAQAKVESRNFGIRKNVLQFDDVMNKQREIIYKQRDKVLNGENIRDYVLKMTEESIDSAVNLYLNDQAPVDEWNFDGLRTHFYGWLADDNDFRYSLEKLQDLNKNDVRSELKERAAKMYEAREADITPETMRELERVILLRQVDSKWMDHIDAMDELKRGIYLRAYGQRDPVVEYRLEGFEMFDQMIESIREDTVKMLYTVRVTKGGDRPKREQVAKPVDGTVGGDAGKKPVKAAVKVGVNDPCPCGSGKKYKKCCGA